ncbi:hypothetical protein QTO34_006370 [Cnephaeus nilssonii]|uniref:Uncharacterized protein n=1 Tax=Cnephaeus nilssonii TaxID=3371016 RepID=A0AA40HKF3_CNENI|nr:hypothetical protein QTO34_006370 [Eptesicus nilssonii]
MGQQKPATSYVQTAINKKAWATLSSIQHVICKNKHLQICTWTPPTGPAPPLRSPKPAMVQSNPKGTLCAAPGPCEAEHVSSTGRRSGLRLGSWAPDFEVRFHSLTKSLLKATLVPKITFHEIL